ncbi:hypothetical protein EW146_g6347, partial [Bondarzewia mesenterica]
TPDKAAEVVPAPLSASAIDHSIMNRNEHVPMDSSQLAASSRREDVLSSTAANGSRDQLITAADATVTGLNCWSRENPIEPRNSPTTHRAHSVKQETTPRRPSISSARGPSSAVPMSSVSPPKMQPPMVTINAGSRPATPNYIAEKASYLQAGSGSTGSGSGSSSWGHHRKGLSIDKMGFGKIFGSGSEQTHMTNGMGSC